MPFENSILQLADISNHKLDFSSTTSPLAMQSHFAGQFQNLLCPGRSRATKSFENGRNVGEIQHLWAASSFQEF